MKLKLCAILALLVACTTLSAFCANVKTVKSLEELMPYLTQDNVNVKMAPGTYKFTVKDAKNKKFKNTIDVVEGKFTHALVMIKGSNCTYDFTDVTIEFETKVFNAFGSEFVELHVIGNNNHVKNLTMVDVGDALDFPKFGCVNTIVDGESNCIDGITIRSTGSFPYGYGELFGKGGPTTIKHKKHSALLVRGYKNHIKDCKIYHRAYGHCLFMQAADLPLIEGCYIEGALTTTDNVLKEAGSGSRADLINFKTVWGYKVPKGHTIALTEAGIRAYNTGNTIINGERFTKRSTSNATVRNCTVKNARVGVVIAHSKGKNLIENCTAIGVSSTGYSTSNGGKIINCKADVTFGPAFVIPYEQNRNITADIILTGYPEKERYVGNGSKQVAMIKGSGHNITFRLDPSLTKKDMKDYVIKIGGDDTLIGNLAKIDDFKASKNKITNETEFAMELGSQTSENTIVSAGKVTDLGTNNTVTKK